MKKVKRPVTLIEIMIVILLIGLVGGALAFNMRGSLDQGKVFKTEQTLLRIHDALMMEAAKGDLSMDSIAENWQSIAKQSPFFKKGFDYSKDAWNKSISVKIADDDFVVISPGLNDYQKKHAKK
jgi:type II secretory pathway pseudopilin PulG